MADPAATATIAADGKVFTGWKALTVRRVYGDSVSTFQFTVSDAKNEATGLLPGARCVIKLGGVKALDGFITDRGCSFDGNTHDVLLAGKSLTTDPADSSAPIQPGNFDGYTAQQIARGLLQPHNVGLKVTNVPPGFDKPFPFFAINPGETALSAIGRAMMMRGAFIWDDVDGNLCVGQADTSVPIVAALQEGRNLLRCTSKVSDQRRVAVWNTYGQQPGVGDDFSMRSSQGQVLDPGARQNRIAVAHCPHPADPVDAATYAGLLAARANWDTIEVEATVAGWIAPSGKLWTVADSVSLYSPMAIPNGTGSINLGVQAVTYSLVPNDQGDGVTTTLSLTRPDLLAPFGHAAVRSDATGTILGATPQPSKPVPSDTGS